MTTGPNIYIYVHVYICIYVYIRHPLNDSVNTLTGDVECLKIPPTPGSDRRSGNPNNNPNNPYNPNNPNNNSNNP